MMGFLKSALGLREQASWMHTHLVSFLELSYIYSSSASVAWQSLLLTLTSIDGHCYLLSTALDFPKEERMMQQSSVSISLSFFENQGINPVGGYARVPRTYTKTIAQHSQRA